MARPFEKLAESIKRRRESGELAPQRPTTVQDASTPGRRTVLVQPKPIAPRPTRQLTWEEAQPLIRSNPLLKDWKKEDFVRTAQSEGIQQWNEREPVRQAEINNINQRWQRDYDVEKAKEETTAYEADLQRQIDAFENTTRALQLGEDATPWMEDSTTLIATLLAQEGEEHQAARSTAAGILANNQALFKPFIEAQLGEDWWKNNYERIQANLDTTGRTKYWDREDGLGALPGAIASNIGLVAGEAAGTDVGQYLLNVLKQSGESAALTLGAARAAIDPNDNVSATQAARFGLSTLGQLPAAVGAAVIAGKDMTGERFIEDDEGNLLSFDLDGDGSVNLREALGRDPEYGGRLLGAIDTLGLAAIDPASWVTLAPPLKASAAIRTLQMSDNSAARMAGTRIRNGAKLADLSDVEQVATRSVWQRAFEEAAIRSRRYRIAENAGRSADQLEKLAEKITQRQLDKVESAVARGSVPGIRVGGTTVLPMTRLYNAVGIIDSRLARESAWAQRLAQTVDIKKPQDFLAFVHNFDGEIPPEAREQILQWGAVADKFTPENWRATMRQLLWRSPDVDAQFDEIEAFGRQLLGDDAVADWRPWFERGKTRKTGGFNQRANPYTPYDIDEMPVAGRVNARILDNGAEWVAEPGALRGVRGLYQAEGIAGRIYRGFANAMSTGTTVKNSPTLGRQVWDETDMAIQEAAAIRQHAYDMAELLQIGPNRKSALETAATAENPNWAADIDRALSGKGTLKAAVNRLNKANKPATARLLEALGEMDRVTREMSDAAGGGTNLPTPRVFSEKGRRFADQHELTSNTKLSEALESMGLLRKPGREFKSLGDDKLRQGGAFNLHTYEESMYSISQLNAKARKDLIDAGIDPSVAGDFELYESNPVTAAMMRSQQAQEAMVYTSMLDGMANIKAPNGRPLAYYAPPDDIKATVLRMKADDAGFGRMPYTKVELPNGGRWYVERTIKEEIDRTRRIVGSTSDMGVVKKFATMHNNLWGAGVTVINPAFHARNGVGNAFNMFLAGMRNPRYFVDAAKFQVMSHKINVAMREGLTFEDAMKRVGVGAGDARILRDLRKYDLAGQNRVTDLLNEYDPLNPETTNRLADNRLVHTGRDVGSFIENNARVALYLDGIEKGLVPKVAASRVREFLFDYQDITQFEAENIRMASRFYTFTRKNTALQARVLATTPGTIINAERVMGEFQDFVMASFGFDRNEDGSIEIPEYLEGSQSYIKTITGPDGNPISQRMFANMETPFDAFLDTSESLGSLFMMPAWLTAAVARPEEGLPAASEHARKMTQLLSGGPWEIITTVQEYQSGIDSFTGRDLAYQDRTWIDRMTRFTDLFFPAGSLLDRNAEGYGLYEALNVMQDPEFADNNQGRARMINTFMGLSLYFQEDVDHSVTSPEMKAMILDLKDQLHEAQQDIPHDERLYLEDLVEMGNLASRNEILQHVLYNGRMPDEFTEADWQWLNRQIPKTIQDHLGLEIYRGDGNTSSRTPEEAVRRARNTIEALRLAGIEVDQAMEDDILKYNSGLTMSEIEDTGIGAFRPQNPYRQKLGLDANPEAIAAANRKFMEETLELMGRGTFEEFVEANPVMTQFDRKVSQMREAGYDEDEIVGEILEDLSRERQALIFGEDSLDMFKQEETYSGEQLQKMERAAANEVSQLDWLWLYQFGRRPTALERDNYLAQVFFTSPEIKRVGLDPYYAPSREDKTSDETWLARHQQEASMLDRVAGTNYMDRMPATVDDE